MSSKDKEPRLSKLKQFFGVKSSGGVIKEKDIWPELEKELRPETPVANRCKTLVELGEFVLNTKLEYASVVKLWDLTKDLIVDNKPTEHRQTTLTFYRKLIEGQFSNLSAMRENFFIVIQKHEVEEDLKYRLDLLIALTENGKDISHIEDKIVFFMVQWAPAILEANYIDVFLEMLGNIIKFNTAHLDNEAVIGIIQMACNISCTVDNTDIGLQCLNILDIVIMYYPKFPIESLQLFVITLCRTVNLVPYCQISWKNMKNLLGTYLGCSALVFMCNILNDKYFYEDVALLRGAVFHVNMCTFGSAPCLNISPEIAIRSTVLSSFLHALQCQKIIVTYEVILSMQMMIPKYGRELQEYIWDIVCEIFFAIADNIRYYESTGQSKDLILQKHFHETIDVIETMLKDDEIMVNPEHIYNLIESVSESRPEISVLNLIDYRSSKVTASRPEWLQVLHEFVQRFYHIPRTTIRIKTIQSLGTIMDANRASYEEEILERVVIPEFSEIAFEPDVHVRIVVSKALIDFALHCDTKRCGELLDILHQIINRPFEQYATDETVYTSENEVIDVLTVIEGLIDIFQVKLYRLPSCHAVKIFDMLVGHLETHYEKPKVFEQVNLIRHKIFTWMLKARANSTYRIGFPELGNPNKIAFSHYLGIDSSLPLHGINYQQPISSQSSQETIPTMNYTTISIRRACRTIVTALESDRDYFIFQFVLKELPNIMRNKTLIQGNDIESLALALLKCRIRSERKFAFNFERATSEKHNALVLPAIASLVIYYQFLPTYRQITIMDALKKGIYTSTASICINALTIMVLETPEGLMRKIPEVLLDMSKMKDNVIVAMPILEFLTILCRLPDNLFLNFTTLHYMYIFPIILRYTNPNRYDHYTVALAYQAVAGWFIKCRVVCRRNVIRYICSAIQSNTALLQDLNDVTQNITRNDFSSLNEDSSNRKRSTSLTERSSRIRDSSEVIRPIMNQNIKRFHADLAETCIDFLAKHTYSPCQSLPVRLPAADYLLRDGISQTWMVGQNIVTITTNTILPSIIRNGVCQNCAMEIDNIQQPSKVSLNMANVDLSLLSLGESVEGAKDNSEKKDEEISMNQQAEVPVTSQPAIQQHHNCTRLTNGWAEVYIRRPTGNVSWIMRIQNPISTDYYGLDMSERDVINFLMPNLHGGVFGYDFFCKENAKSSSKLSEDVVGKEDKLNPKEYLKPEKPDTAETVIKLDSLDDKNDIHDTSDSIYIPKVIADFEAVSNEFYDNDASNCVRMPYEDYDSFSGIPFRRVNSSPDVSSSFLETLKSSSNYFFIEPVSQKARELKETSVSDFQNNEITEGCVGDDISVSRVNSEFEEHKLTENIDTNIKLPLPESLTESENVTPTTTSILNENIIQKKKTEPSTGSSSANDSSESTSDSEKIRVRSNTISGLREIFSRERNENFQSNTSFNVNNFTKNTAVPKSGINPSFIFLQLFHTGQFQLSDQPIKVPVDMLSKIDSFDQVPPFDIHNITVLYVGPGQTNEVEILRNRIGSTRYVTFLQNMGSLVRIGDIKMSDLLNQTTPNDSNGMFTYVWKDLVVQVTFQATTLIPNKATDPNCTEKMNNIRNNLVAIVYNESGQEFNMETIKGLFNYACVVVQPAELHTNRITMLTRPEIKSCACHSEPIILSDKSAPLMARQLALHANLASLVFQSLKSKNPYASNWLERLRKVKELRTQLISDNKTHKDDDDISNYQFQKKRDFTLYA